MEDSGQQYTLSDREALAYSMLIVAFIRSIGFFVFRHWHHLRYRECGINVLFLG